jgi:hypothetical protein
MLATPVDSITDGLRCNHCLEEESHQKELSCKPAAIDMFEQRMEVPGKITAAVTPNKIQCFVCAALVTTQGSSFCNICARAMEEEEDDCEAVDVNQKEVPLITSIPTAATTVDDLVLTLRISSPNDFARRKLLEALKKGEVITLSSSQRSGTTCHLARMETVETVLPSTATTSGSQQIHVVASSPESQTPLAGHGQCVDCHATLAQSWMTRCPSCYGRLKRNERVLQPVSTTDAATIPKESTAHCLDCKVEVKHIWMTRCSTCYDKHKLETTNPCRLCKQETGAEWKEYCLRCYQAKQRDDANGVPSLSPPVLRRKGVIPYKCTDCGATTREAWMTRCDGCFAKSNNSKRQRMEGEQLFRNL